MKKLFLFAALFLAMHAQASDGDMRWAFGDLTPEDVAQDQLKIPDSAYRAVTSKQLKNHEARRVQIVVHKSMKERGYQFLTVAVDGEPAYEAVVSTAWERLAKAKTRSYQSFTPVGKFIPDSMQERRFSHTWQVWLEHVILFSGGVWMHATSPEHFMELGAPASGGCVRLHPRDAEAIFNIVKYYGIDETAITVLPQDSDEAQIPWTLQKREIPVDVMNFRKSLNIQ